MRPMPCGYSEKIFVSKKCTCEQQMPLLECSCLHTWKHWCTQENHCCLHDLVMRPVSCEAHIAVGRQALVPEINLSLLASFFQWLEAENRSQWEGSELARPTEIGVLVSGIAWSSSSVTVTGFSFLPTPLTLCFPLQLLGTGSPLWWPYHMVGWLPKF